MIYTRTLVKRFKSEAKLSKVVFEHIVQIKKQLQPNMFKF